MAKLNCETVVKNLAERYGWNVIGQFVLNGMILSDRFQWKGKYEDIYVHPKEFIGIESGQGTDPSLGDLVEEGVVYFDGNPYKGTDSEMLTLCRATEPY